MAEKRKYKYRATRGRGHFPAWRAFPKTRSFFNRDDLIKYYATTGLTVVKIYSSEAHGNLKCEETFDGFQREIALQAKIIELEKMLKDAKRHTSP
jgi:hypothetical protein